MEKQWAIMAGTPWDGFKLYGPFGNEEEAEQYQNDFLFSTDFWWIMLLEKEV